jgi:hypothetical protein
MDRFGNWLALLANLGVVAGLLLLAYEINQNTSQMRNEASFSINQSLHDINESQFSDPILTEILLRGEQDLSSLNPVEKAQFTRYQFTRLNLCEYILGLENEGLSDVHITYVGYIVNEFNSKPGLAEWISEYDGRYGGSQKFYDQLSGVKKVTSTR